MCVFHSFYDRAVHNNYILLVIIRTFSPLKVIKVVDVGLGQLVLTVCPDVDRVTAAKCRGFAACSTKHCAVTHVLTVK